MHYSNDIVAATVQSIRTRQIRFLYEMPVRVLINAVNAAIVAAVLWSAVPSPVLLSWVALTSLVAAGRFALSRWFNRTPQPEVEIEAAAWRYAAGSFASGILWGASVAVMWLTPDAFMHVFVAFVTGGMCAAVAATNSYHLPTVHVFTLPASVPWIVGLVFWGEPIYFALAVMWVLFLLFLSFYARAANRILLRSLRLQAENTALVEGLSQARDTLEARVRERTAELEATNATLQREVQAHAETERHLRQAQKMEAIGQLTGGVAHDFNNLLAVIQGNTELLSEAIEEDNPLMQAILRATERGATLTQRLLAFSRRQMLHPQAVDMARLIEDIRELMERTLGETIVVMIDAAPDLWPAWADQSQVENALLNLAINARDAMPDGGVLGIDLSNATVAAGAAAGPSGIAPGDYVVLSVSDTGIGMTNYVLEHAFEPFFTTKEVGKGSGLGLSMIHGFAEQSGGHVQIDSTIDDGTTVTLYLPRSREPVAATEAGTGDAVLQGYGEIILVVEDDSDMRRLTARMLHSLGYRVMEASNAAVAAEICSREPDIDLVLSDVVLPGGRSGPAFAREIAGSGRYLRFLFMSGYPAPKRDTVPEPAETILRKPFQKWQLAEAVADALRQQP